MSRFWTLWRVLNQLNTAWSGRSDQGKGMRPYKSVSVVVNLTIPKKHIDRRLDETTAASRKSYTNIYMPRKIDQKNLYVISHLT